MRTAQRVGLLLGVIALVTVTLAVPAPAEAVTKPHPGDIAFDKLRAKRFLLGGSEVTPTANELNAAADVSVRHTAVADADYTVLVADSGKPHIIANVTADRTITLPTAASGLEYEFYADVVAADDFDWIFDTSADVNFFTGGLVFVDTDAAPATIAVLSPDGNSNSQLQINLPQGATRLLFICDGTNWTVSGIVNSVTIPAFSDQ